MDNTLKKWHANSGYSSSNKRNHNHMIERNLAYIGLGDDRDEYISRSNANGFTTPKQFEKFEKEAKKGDKIYLYQKGVGYIKYG